MQTQCAPRVSHIVRGTVSLAAMCVTAACSGRDSDRRLVPSGGEVASTATVQRDELSRGREVFRFETFGNERFWSDAARLPQGVTAEHVTLIQAIGANRQFMRTAC